MKIATKAGDQPAISALERVLDPSPVSARGAPGTVWRGLLWCEWFAHSRLLLAFLVGWLVAVWALPLAADPGWILMVGVAYAFIAGPAFGGGEVLEGCEEFTFALPATRSTRYLTRLLVGGGSLLVLTAMDLLALGLDLSQAVARLYLDTGLIKPVQLGQPGLLYGLVLTFPLAVFAFSFTCAALTHSRAQVFLSWFWGALAAMTILRAGLQYEQLTLGKMNGYVVCPALLILAIAALSWGFLVYRRKEVGPPVTPMQLPGHWWAWTLLFLLGVALALILIGWLANHVPAVLKQPS